MHDLCTGHPLRHHVRWLIVTRDRLKSSMDSSEITLEAVSSVSQVPAEDWDACANPSMDLGSLNGLDTLASANAANHSCISSTFLYNPFVSHAFFSALEGSGSACARTGWGPRHLLARPPRAPPRGGAPPSENPPPGANPVRPGLVFL